MKHQSLPKSLYLTAKQTRKQIGEPGWSSFIRPIDQSMPEHSFQCECEMCSNYDHKKYFQPDSRFKQALHLQTINISQVIKQKIATSDSAKQQALQFNFHWVVKHLMIPTHKIATSGLKIYITETLFLKDGEATQLFFNKDYEDPIIRRVPKDKLNNTYVQRIMSDRKRKYRDYIRLKTGRKKNQQKKKLFFGQKEVKKQIKDAVLVRYVQGYEQLLSQNQYLQLSLRRKQDPIWRQIASIRNFMSITPSDEQNKTSYMTVKFNRTQIKYIHLFERSQIWMKVLGEYITTDDEKYISQSEQSQFAKNLQASSLQIHAQYLVYQIVSFIEYFYDQQINIAQFGLFFDEVGHAYLNQVYKLEFKSLVQFSWTNEIYRKRMDEAELNVLTSRSTINQQTYQDGASGIVMAMHKAYEKMRDRLGLTAQEEDDQEQIANNSFFKAMHPAFKQDISQVLKDPKLSLSQFKRVYLGFKPKKKPIVKQFTSNLIKTLHLTCPRLETANPHDYISSPSKLSKYDERASSKRQSILLSPIRNSKLYQTLPVRSARHK